ncbi:hypothetical protein H920_04056 [Fukomys damarensis]|uniref:Uncharacterized protein n=1 Tax=Fukomys damarensis TaxID=885580 RepID=A0A091DQY2_FUKDA|nr:hypothetical protein H920_04056 [Fukomys damarensis]
MVMPGTRPDLTVLLLPHCSRTRVKPGAWAGACGLQFSTEPIARGRSVGFVSGAVSVDPHPPKEVEGLSGCETGGGCGESQGILTSGPQSLTVRCTAQATSQE